MAPQHEFPKPAERVAHQTQDVWSIINEAAAQSPVQPIINMGQGFFGYNPPDFIIEAAQEAVTRVDANQYSPSKGRPRLKRALATTYSKAMGREINPETEVTISTGANEGILSAFMAFIQNGDEVIVFEPFFDQYISNIEMAGGVVRYVPLAPPALGDTASTSSADWTLDLKKLEETFSSRTRMVIVNTPHNPVGKIFSREELTAIGELCVKYNAIILADEVYDSLYYVPLVRMATLSPEIWNLTLTVGSAGKSFYATGWRVGYLIGPEHLIKYVSAAHMRICYSSPSPLQEACAIGFERAEEFGFWESSRREMTSKIRRFTEVCDELGLPYTEPQGGYFVMVNFSKVKIPEKYEFPPHVERRARDFKLAWFLIMEFGLAAIPPSEFYLPENQHVAENYLRFAICKEDSVIEGAKDRLRQLKKYISA
ncbi:putative kynurenine aminotransferase [Xylariales sp. PMI_506]|nr:putative kynurenine aminotransferase [Xylariales sp. PMI_506]